MDAPPAPELPPPFVPPPPSPPPQPAPPPVPTSRHRTLWYSALAVAVVVTLGGLGLLYQDDVKWQRQAGDLRGQNATLHEQLLTTRDGLQQSQQQVSALTAELKNPTVGIWNVQQKINGPDWYLAGGVPDTFTYHLTAFSTGPMSVSILTFEAFAAAIQCVDNGDGNAHACMHRQRSGTVMTWANVTSINYDFHLAEGCANYLVVFTAASAVTVTPDVTVTYNPARTFTGDC